MMPKFNIYITETIEHKVTVDAPSLEWVQENFITDQEYPITEELGALIDTRPMDHTPSARHDKLSDHEVLDHQEIVRCYDYPDGFTSYVIENKEDEGDRV
jgi:hypothetical protein